VSLFWKDDRGPFEVIGEVALFNDVFEGFEFTDDTVGIGLIGYWKFLLEKYGEAEE
jgi:hypothetical protein